MSVVVTIRNKSPNRHDVLVQTVSSINKTVTSSRTVRGGDAKSVEFFDFESLQVSLLDKGTENAA